MRTCHGGQYKSKEWVHKGVVGGINRGSMVGLGGLGARMALSRRKPTARACTMSCTEKVSALGGERCTRAWG